MFECLWKLNFQTGVKLLLWSDSVSGSKEQLAPVVTELVNPGDDLTLSCGWTVTGEPLSC